MIPALFNLKDLTNEGPVKSAAPPPVRRSLKFCGSSASKTNEEFTSSNGATSEVSV